MGLMDRMFNRSPAGKPPEIDKDASGDMAFSMSDMDERDTAPKFVADVPKDMTGVDFSKNSQQRLEREIAEKEQMRARAIEAREYPRLKILNEEISRLKEKLRG